MQNTHLHEDFYIANQQLWDTKTPIHEASNFYRLSDFLNGWNSLNPPELEALGATISNKTLLHLQCHFGQDTLSWARLGAIVTGLDFSAKAIETARKLAQTLHLEQSATFVCGSVYETANLLHSQKFDVVFTSYGVLIWLGDLDNWANNIVASLKKGGTFYLVEFHPALLTWDTESMNLRYPYFYQPAPILEVLTNTYASTTATTPPMQEFTWSHSISEVLQALMRSGLVLEEFKEFDASPYSCFPNMELVKEGQYAVKGLYGYVPHLYALKMRLL